MKWTLQYFSGKPFLTFLAYAVIGSRIVWGSVPLITDFAPHAAPQGTLLSIAGANFSSYGASNVVYFGAVRANVLAATANNLVVAVPSGATFGPISVTVGGLTAASGSRFLPTFTGTGSNIISADNFAPAFTMDSAVNPAGCVLADFDGDGKPDIAIVSGFNHVLSIYRNISTNGVPLSAASFAPAINLTFPTNGVAGNPDCLWAMDMDGDGKIDLVAAEVSGNRVSVFHNISTPGNLTTNSFEPPFALIAGNNCRQVIASDLDGDGRVDIVGANQDDNTLSLFKNIGSPGILNNSSFAPAVTVAAAGGPHGLAIADLNGDGRPDLLVANEGDGTVSVFPNAGGSLLSNPFTSRFDLPCGGGAVSVQAVDLDGDGRLDLAAATYAGGAMAVFQNVGTNGVLTANSFAPVVSYPLGYWAHTVSVGDFDGDGRPDLVVVGEMNSTVSLFQNLSAPGVFTNASLATPVTLPPGFNPCDVVVADLDGDGRPDVVFANNYDNNVEIYQNLSPFGTPATPPTIVSQPTNVMVVAGGTAVFSVGAGGTSPLGYQWSFNGTNVAGATNSVLTLANVSLAQAGYYSVTVSNVAGITASSNAFLTVYPLSALPAITAQTPSQVVLLGSPVTFSVTATGAAPLNYFWSRNGSFIPNATNSSYVLASAQLSDSGSRFSCLVTNAYGFAGSSNMTLKVIDTISNDLCSGAVVVTSLAYTNRESTANASSIGDPVPDCIDGFGNGVWYQFTTPVAGLLSVDTFGSDFDTGLAAYTGIPASLAEAACNDDAGSGVTSQIVLPSAAGVTYYFLAGGYSGHVGNLIFHLNYFTPPVFAGQPTNLAVVVSNTAVFSPTVTGSTPMAFQWYFNNAPLTDGGRVSGAASATLTVANVQPADQGNYQLVASNIVGVSTSSVAVLTPVFLPPVFTVLPASQSVGAGSNVTFSAAVTGTPPFSYQWLFNDTPLADNGFHIFGSTTPSLTISNLSLADAGAYTLVVTNQGGSTNVSVSLTVLIAPVITQQPVGRSLPSGFSTVFTAAASGEPAPTYQWLLNGTNIPGANSPTYTVPLIGPATAGNYQLTASNQLGGVASSKALLTVGPVAAWGGNGAGQSLPPPGLTNVIGIAGGTSMSLALEANGQVVGWGASAPPPSQLAAMTNSVRIFDFGNGLVAGLLADGTVSENGTTITGWSNIVAVAGSTGSQCGVRVDGTVIGALANVPGNLLPTLNHVKAVACGQSCFMVLRNDGSVSVWGYGAVTNVPTGLSGVSAIAAGYSYCLALQSNGVVAAWGTGTGVTMAPKVTDVVAIAAQNDGDQSLSLALRANGTVLAWGDNMFGETNTPAAMSQLYSVAVAAGANHSLALVNDGSAQILQPPVGFTTYAGRDVTLQAGAVGAAPLNYQWLFNGTNMPGATNATLVVPNIQLANAGNYQLWVSNRVNTALSLPAPVTVISNSGLSFLTQSSVSSSNVYQGGRVAVYGGVVQGNGPLSYQWYFSPTNRGYVSLPGATNDSVSFDPALAVESGNYYLAVSNQFGGITSAPVFVRVMFAKAWGGYPTDAPFVVTNATAVAVGNAGVSSVNADYYALTSAGKIVSWSTSYSPYGETNFAALSNSIVTAIAAGYQDSLALKSDGTVFAAGYSNYGETNVPGAASGITAIACGDYHDLALRYDGTVIGWGQNTSGQTVTTNATNVVAIAAGGQSSIALRADGTVMTWGAAGLYPFQYPIPFNATNVVSVAAGNGFFLALRANGSVVAWGGGPVLQMGIPANWTNIAAIAAGASHCTVLRNDGTVAAAGTWASGIFSNLVPADVTNVIAIASSGDRDLGLFGTRAPAFTVQPWSRTVPVTATSVWFSAKCAGAQPVAYQWQCNGTNISGATNDTLVINASVMGKAPLPLSSGVYQLVARNAYGVVASKYAQLNVVIPLGQALNATNLNWTTTGATPWFGETNITHDGVAAAQSGDIGPLDETILQTTMATNVPGVYSFWWKVSSEPDFDYLEFRINGLVVTNISGEVNWQQVIVPVSAGTNVLMWRYSKNSVFGGGLDAGWVDQFAFAPNPVILRQPSSLTVYAGSRATFGVVVDNRNQLPLGYQWQKNGVNLVDGVNVTGSHTAALALYNVQDADAAVYTVIVTTSGGGSVTSAPATLTVQDTPPWVWSQTGSLTNHAGTTATFTVTALGALPITYQWQKNGTNLPVTGSLTTSLFTLALTNVQDADAGIYAVILTNVDGCVTSAPAALVIVDGQPVIVTAPTDAAVFVGQPATFTVAASGTTPIGYQWLRNGTNLPAATNASLTLPSVQWSDRGPYQVLVTNAYGTVSAVANLTVLRTRLMAWGNNAFGQTNLPALTTNVVAAAAGNYHGLAVTADGMVVAWGENGSGQCNIPPGLVNVAAVAGGYESSLALRGDGTVAAWGDNSYGELNLPTNLDNVVAIAAGGNQCLALLANGTVVHWGDGHYGETNVPPLTNVTAIAAGADHDLALQADGTVVAWGADYDHQADVPAGLTNVVAISAGDEHSLALKADGTVVAWGYDGVGQIDVPAGLTNVVAVAGGGSHSLALQADGTVVAWGYGGQGQTNVPPGLTNAVAVSGGSYYSLAIQGDGSPFIAKQPASQVVAANGVARFQVKALGIAPLTYQWQKNGVNLADGGNVTGTATASLVVSNVAIANMADYSVVVANGLGTTVSAPAALIIAGVPVIVTQPVSQTVTYGATVRFSVTAIGSPAPSYQWWWNGTNQVGANSASFTLTSAGRMWDGVYCVAVTNLNGGVVSSNVVLKVLVPQQLAAPAARADGVVQLLSSDIDGGGLTAADLPNFTALASTNLVDWVVLPNALSLTNGQLLLQDHPSPNCPARYYRIVEQ